MELMVYVNGKSIDTTTLDAKLIQGEANIESPIIILPLSYNGIDLTALTYILKAVNSKNDRIEYTLRKEITADCIRLEWVITSDFTTACGQLNVELVGVSSDRVEIIKFKGYPIRVRSSLTGEYSKPGDIIDNALYEMHIGVDQARGYADNAKLSEDNAVKQAADALASAIAAKLSEDNAFASAVAAKMSEDNAKLSEVNSKSSEGIVVQVMHDFLSMQGEDIATLVGGKIPVEQLPSLATTEIYRADSLTVMNALVVQNGDICIRTDENKSYIYSDGWVYLASPTDYASRAGYAETATNATNATMINNHRMVEMSQAEFDTAVKDENTYYLVW